MKLSDCKTVEERSHFLQNKLSIPLDYIQKAAVDSDELVHCENRIGSISIPLGIAGPLRIKGEKVKGEYYIPLATTEGALIASVSRGAKACFEQGIVTSVDRVGVTRGPVLKAKTIGGAKKIESWVWDHMDELAKNTKESSNHIKLMDVTIKKAGLYIFIKFAFDTDKAMGMNMATIASQNIIDHIATQTNSTVIAVAGNLDSDKKPAWMNAITGRGFVVQAEAVLSHTILKDVLKTDAKRLYEVWQTKCFIGSALAGSIGFNAHHANIVAAFYAATGQDLAHVVEGSMGQTIINIIDEENIYISVHLPCVMVGTIGGGTKLKTQTEARSLLKSDSPYVLAEVLGSAVLAGELSLLASLSEGTLAQSHKILGR